MTSADACETYGHDLVTGASITQETYKANDPAGRAVIKTAEYVPPFEEPYAEYPFWLSTGRLVYHFHTRTKTGRARELTDAAPRAELEMSPADADRLGVRDGDRVAVESRRGRAVVPVKIADIPSLGPTAYLLAVDWAHPASRAYNTVAGHAIGLGAGFAMVALLSAWDDPVPLAAGTLTFARVAAAALALGITVLVAVPLKASHPPAGATALLVALGAVDTLREALGLLVGAAMIAMAGILLRAVRAGRFRRKQEMTRARRLEPVMRPS